ncbi:hypothetical protein MVEN_01140300 [Mycena venus]|uniref:Uncharacterized protein n=1 Tax=Mycena venus TaxID=2733690 RepID=A0A8H6Y8S4_9AGAR|nr:hypothetical protein MVEN_01140300 [Mycena venus]
MHLDCHLPTERTQTPSPTLEMDAPPTSVAPAPSVPAFPLSVAPDVLCFGPSSMLYPPPHLSSARRPYSTQFQAKDIQHHRDVLRLFRHSLGCRTFAMHPCLTHLSTTFLPSPIADAKIHNRVQPALFHVHSYPPLEPLYELIQRISSALDTHLLDNNIIVRSRNPRAIVPSPACSYSAGLDRRSIPSAVPRCVASFSANNWTPSGSAE